MSCYIMLYIKPDCLITTTKSTATVPIHDTIISSKRRKLRKNCDHMKFYKQNVILQYTSSTTGYLFSSELSSSSSSLELEESNPIIVV